MGEMKHLVVAKFKEDVVVDDIIQGMEKLVSDLDLVLSFDWGKDVESPEMLRQGFTHAFFMTFRTHEDFTAFLGHPKHAEFSATFSTAIDKVLLLDFPAVLVKKPVDEPPAELPADEPPAELPADEPPAELPADEPPAELPADEPPAELPAEESPPPCQQLD